MSDPYLMAMMRGEFSGQKTKATVPKDKFDMAAEKYLEQYVETLDLEIDDGRNQLDTLEVKKARMCLQIMSELRFKELDSLVIKGLKYVVAEGAQFLDQGLYGAMLDQFTEMGEHLEDLDFDKPENFNDWSNLTQDVLDGIVRIGIAAYGRGQYALCLSMFALLASVKSDNADYWLRLGIAAQKNEDYELALKAYTFAIKINPVLIEARLFSAECYLKKSLVQNAKEELVEAKELSKIVQLDETLSAFLSVMEEIIAEEA